MTIVKQDIQGLLKEKYPMVMNNTIVNRTEILDLATEMTNAKVYDGPDGKYYKLANLVGGMQGNGSRLENQNLPEGGSPIVINPLLYLKYHYARIDFTWQEYRAATGGEVAFADFSTSHILPSVEALSDDLDRQACGYGGAILCRVDEASPDTTLQLDAPFGIANDTKGYLNVKAGMKIVFSPNADGSGLRDGGTPAKVLSVDPTGNSGGGIATIDALPSGVLDDDYIFRGDLYGTNLGANGVEAEMMGIEGFYDDGTVVETLQNVSRTTTAEYKTPVINASAAPYSGTFTDGLAMKMVTDARTIGGARINAFLCSHDVARQAFAAVRSLGGFGATRDGNTVRMGTKGVVVDTPLGSFEVRGVSRIVPGRAYAIQTDQLCRFQDGMGQWVDFWDGSIFHQQQVGGAIKDAGFMYYRKPLQLGIIDPRKGCKASGIVETTY